MPVIYKGEVKTAPKDAEGKPVKGAEGIVVAKYSFEGPENKAELDKGLADKITVTIVALNADGSEKPAETAEFDNFEAWEYGAGLKANQLGRKAADIAKGVTDHILSFGNQRNDLDAKNPEDLAKALNMVAQFIAGGFDIGATNTAKVNDKIEKSLAAGIVHKDAKGLFVAGPGKGNGAKK